MSPANSRYFTDGSGRAIFLAGFHTWYNVIDGGGSSPPPLFDWSAYLEALVANGCNFTKLWASLETAQLWADPFASGFNPQYFSPNRYARTGPGTAADGLPKFDLAQIDQSFLARLRARVIECGRNGIYCCIQFMQGWQIDTKSGSDNPWTYHPYRLENNINGVDGDDNNDGQGTETHTDAGNNVFAYQEAMVEAIIDTLNDLDNVFWEISNEDTGSTNNTDWQEYMIAHVAAYEATKPKQHAIGRTVCWPNGSNTALDASAAAWVSYNGDKADDVLDGTKVAMRDSDHVEGITDEYPWMWTALCNGSGGSWYMDPWDGALYGTDTTSSPDHQLIRANLGYVRALVALLDDMIAMTPQPALCGTGYCLAKDHATAAEYVCFQPSSGSFTLDLSNAAGTLNIRWLRCSNGATSTDTVSGGAERTLAPPWSGAVVAYIYH